MKNKCIVLVNSCDAYSDTWYPFFKLLKKYWPNREFPVFLNTESKKYEYEDMNINVINLPAKLKAKKYITWGKRMIETLKRIDSEYVIFMLDDFFLTDYVNDTMVNQVLNWMDTNKNIAVFSLYPVSKNAKEDTISLKYPGFCLRNQKGPYRYNCQAAIWRKEELIKCFRKTENPWEWELVGNKRSFTSSKEFYALKDKSNLPFKYYFCDIGIVRGKWKLPETADFFEKENIEIDFSIRNKMHDMKKKEEEKKIENVKRKGKIYYFIFRVKKRIYTIKNKIMIFICNAF